MEFILALIIFIISCILMTYASRILVESLSKVALFLRVREFIIATFIMAFGVSIPNLVVGVVSALKGMPELSLGDVLGGNIFDITMALGLAVLFSKQGIPAQSRTVQKASMVTIGFALLPLLLMIDGQLSRGDGLTMMILYLIYIIWFFSDPTRISRPYEKHERCPNVNIFIKNFFLSFVGIALLIVGGYGIVESATVFAKFFGLPLAIIGVFVVGISNCLPETFFCIQAGRNNQEWMVLGNIMGSVIFAASFTLGLVAFIHPITMSNIGFLLVGRIFLIIACLLFLIFVKTDKQLTKKEALVLVGLYVLFLVVEILLRDFVF